VSAEYSPGKSGGAPAAKTFERCLRRCEACGIGLSNASSAADVVVVYQNPLHNLPAGVRAGAMETIGNAINLINRTSKRNRFCSTNSEDAVTWTVFRHLARERLLTPVLARLQVQPATNAACEPALLLWGARPPADEAQKTSPPADSAAAGHAMNHETGCAAELVKAIDSIENNPRSRSEPDVVLDFGDAGVVFIEVKCTSKNDTKKPEHAGWPSYISETSAFADVAGVKNSQLYELARNWRIAWQYADGRPFTLVNLGPAKLFAGKNAPPLAEFAGALAQSKERSFMQLDWPAFMQAIPAQPDWLRAYDASRGLSVARR